MAKKKLCPKCDRRVPTNNKSKILRHERWNWPGYPDFNQARSSNMSEVWCEGSEVS
jgi:hypothetical protein